ncbi:MAG: hypothetical protein KF693_06690 [Nitrospira sp.]|nr:hypothetical protein [Nitrospira sp.]
MGIVFKPYVAFGLGSSVRQLTYEFDNARTLHIKGPVSDIIETIPLEGAQAKRLRTGGLVSNFAAKVCDVGDVMIIASSSKETLCPNISGVQAFMQAVEGTHPDVQPIKPVELEDFVLCIPQMPQTLDDAMFALCENSLRFNGDFVKVGQMVKKGDPVTLSGEPVIAPVDGKIVMLGAMNVRSRWNKGEKWPTYTSMGSDNPVTRDCFETRFKIQPVKGSSLTDSITYAYHKIFEGFELGYANPAPIARRLAQGGESHAEKSVATKKTRGYEAIEMLQSAKYKTQAINPSGEVTDYD